MKKTPLHFHGENNLQILVNAWMRRTTLMVKHFTSFRHRELWTNVDEPREEDHPIVKCLTGDKNSIEKRNEEYHPNSKAPRASLILTQYDPWAAILVTVKNKMWCFGSTQITTVASGHWHSGVRILVGIFVTINDWHTVVPKLKYVI